jgi:predicted permease
VERDVDDEVRFHLDSHVRDLIAQGMSPDDASRAAQREYGDIAASRAELVAMGKRLRSRERRADFLDAARHDLAFAIRGIRRQPGFAAAVVCTLALAIGANGAVFSLIDPLLFRPPAGVAEPQAVRRLYMYRPTRSPDAQPVSSFFSYPEYSRIREALSGEARIAGYYQRDSTAAIRGNDTLVASLTYATADFLPLLGVRALIGRLFSPTEDDLRAPVPVAVLSRSFARRAFGETADPLGQTLTLLGVRYTVVGIADQSFAGIDWMRTDLWVPMSAQPKLNTTRPWYQSDGGVFRLIVRLDERRTSDRHLESVATTAVRRVRTTTLSSETGRSVVVGPILTARGPSRAQKEVAISTRLTGVAVIVLLIACANVGNLLLARSLRRRREIAIRLALGISRWRLAIQLLLESVVLASLAGVAALGVSIWTGNALRVALLPRIRWAEAPVGARVVVACFALTLFAGVIAGVVPAVLASRRSFIDALKSGGRDSVVGRSRVQSGLLVAQVGLSVVLVVGAVLFARSLRNVRNIDVGFTTKALLSVSISFPDRSSHPELVALLPQIVARVQSMPGVVAASYSAGAPFDAWMSVPLFRPGQDSAIKPQSDPLFLPVSPEYFATTETRILAGRAFNAFDNAASEPVMIVNTFMARTLWPGQSPLGQCLVPLERSRRCYRVVGVAADARVFSIIESDNRLQFYFPASQSPMEISPRKILVRVVDGMTGVDIAIRDEVRRSIPGSSVRVESMTHILDPQLRPWRLGAQLFGALGLLAVIVAAIGVYSVIAFAVRRRTREMGVRAALGAQPGDLLRLVVGHGTAVVGIGIIVGVAAALVTGELVESLLYGITPRDPLALAVSAGFLLAVGLGASLFPAWRASRVDPALVLRDE